MDPAQPQGDLSVELQVARDERFDDLFALDGEISRALSARAADDHCVKVRVTGLSAATTWYYRFIYTAAGQRYTSRTGRTRTAPAEQADVGVRFAVVSCQDFNDRYYHSYKRLVKEELDFFVHLGDYIYETTGDPQFQDKDSSRRVTFSDVKGAITFNAGKKSEYYAASSLDNYRELYRTYRADRDLQRVHERLPMIAIWDDHEFSNDCWGQSATYFNGERDERDAARRAHADQAWFEYMPVDYPRQPHPAAQKSFPDNMRIYRDFEFGKHLHLVMTDLRRYRGDHLVPEDAFPGRVVLEQSELQALTSKIPDSAGPYLDVSSYQGGRYAKALADHAAKLDLPSAEMKGKLSATWVNDRLAELAKDGVKGLPPAIDATAMKSMSRGYAWHHFGKSERYGQVGARYFINAEVFSLYAKSRWKKTGGKSETVMGADQRKWFVDTFKRSDRTWKVWGSEFCVLSRILDLSAIPGLPSQFARRFLITADDWQGFPNRRDELLGELGALENVVVVTGDIHAFFAATPWPGTDRDKRVVELVTGAISSSTLHTIVSRAAASPALKKMGAQLLVPLLEKVLLGTLSGKSATRPNPHLGYTALDRHGFLMVDVDAKRLEATCFQIGEDAAHEQITGDVDEKFRQVRFKVEAGRKDLLRDFDGSWRRWDPAKGAWV